MFFLYLVVFKFIFIPGGNPIQMDYGSASESHVEQLARRQVEMLKQGLMARRASSSGNGFSQNSPNPGAIGLMSNGNPRPSKHCVRVLQASPILQLRDIYNVNVLFCSMLAFFIKKLYDSIFLFAGSSRTCARGVFQSGILPLALN